MADGYHRMGGPADKLPPVLAALMQPGTLWRGMAHPKDKMIDMGDIGVLGTTSKGLECYLFAAEKRMVFPWPADDMVVVDRHNHIRVGGKDGKLRVTFAPA